MISSVFYLPDGRLAWSVGSVGDEALIEPHTRIEALVAPDSVETLRTLSGAMERVLADAAGGGVYGRGWPGGGVFQPEHLVFAGFAEDDERLIATLRAPTRLHGHNPELCGRSRERRRVSR